MNNTRVVKLDNVVKIYPLGKTEVHAVKGVSFGIEEGDFISIAGPSGSGKTTILNLIGCIDTPTSGAVEIMGTDTAAMDDNGITRFRHRAIGFIFQSFNLIPVLNVFENIEFPLLLGGRGGSDDRDRKNSRQGNNRRIDELIDAVGLREWRNHKPNELSGGQRQRVAIARALVTKPKIVLADEPTANLDSKTGEAIIGLMKKMNSELNTTFIFSTHDPSIVDIADHIIKLQDGEVVENYRHDRKTAPAGV